VNFSTESLVFIRCAGFISRAPGFSHKAVPRMVRAALCTVFTLAVAPSIADVPPESYVGGSYMLAVLSEFAFGATIGYAASVLYEGVGAGGAALDDYTGVQGSTGGSASSGAGPGLGKLWSMLFLTVYFATGAYGMPIIAFTEGFRSVPPGSIVQPHQWMTLLTSLPQLIVKAALYVAGPAIAVGLFAQLTLGTLGRVIPKFQTQNISFGVMFFAVLSATIATAPLVLPLAGHPWLPLPLPGR